MSQSTSRYPIFRLHADFNMECVKYNGRKYSLREYAHAYGAKYSLEICVLCGLLPFSLQTEQRQNFVKEMHYYSKPNGGSSTYAYDYPDFR